MPQTVLPVGEFVPKKWKLGRKQQQLYLSLMYVVCQLEAASGSDNCQEIFEKHNGQNLESNHMIRYLLQKSTTSNLYIK